MGDTDRKQYPFITVEEIMLYFLYSLHTKVCNKGCQWQVFCIEKG